MTLTLHQMIPMYSWAVHWFKGAVVFTHVGALILRPQLLYLDVRESNWTTTPAPKLAQ